MTAEVSSGQAENWYRERHDGWGFARQLKRGVPRVYLNRLDTQSPINGSVTIVVVVLTTALLLLEGYAQGVWVWAAVQLGLAALMLFRWWRRNCSDQARRRESDRIAAAYLRTRRGLYRALAWAAGSGGLWGTLTVFLPGAPPHVEIALILTMGGMAAGASATLAAVPLVAATFILGCTVPATIYYLIAGGGTATMLALVFAVFTAAMIAMSNVVFSALTKQYDAERHVRQLQELGLQQRIAVMANDAMPMDEVLRLCLREVQEHLRWPAGRIHWLNTLAEPTLASADLWCGDPAMSDGLWQGFEHEVDALRERIHEHGRPLWSSRNDDHTGNRVGTLLGVPILIGTEIVAAMEFVSGRNERPDDETLDILATGGILIGRAIERRRAEERLRRAQKMEAVGQLTSGIAHDFNNILMVAMGNIELLRSELHGDRVQERLSTILASLGSAADKVKALLAYSRKSPIRPEMLNLTEVIESMMIIISPAVSERVRIDTRSRPDLWSVEADRVQLETALLNLALNAAAAMPFGGKLSITLNNRMVDGARAIALEVPAGAFVTIEVSDTGVGISPQVREHVFEPFFTTKPVGEGSGLGLSMVYGFMKQSGGAVTLDSDEGQGTSVCLYFPKAKALTGSKATATQVDRLGVRET